MNNACPQSTPETGHRAENYQKPEILALVYQIKQTLYKTGNRGEAKEMTTEVSQQSFVELYEQSIKKNPDLFNIKRQMEQISFGGRFFCYACTQIYPLSKRMTIRHREFCPDCYKTVKQEPRTKDRSDD